MKNKISISKKSKQRVIKNIGVIRHYLQMGKQEFALKSGVGIRATEFENGRFRPTMDEVEKIAALAEINPNHILNHTLYLTIQIT